MSTTAPKVRVGVGIFILKSRQEDPKNPQFLLGKRKGAHGAGTWALPGGHLEFGETLEACATRETMEETGLNILQPRFFTATNDIMTDDNKHYVTMFMVSARTDDDSQPEVLEPDKCESWSWVDWKELAAMAVRQGEARKGDAEERKLFTPLISLMNQRAGLLPCI